MVPRAQALHVRCRSVYGLDVRPAVVALPTAGVPFCRDPLASTCMRIAEMAYHLSGYDGPSRKVSEDCSPSDILRGPFLSSSALCFLCDPASNLVYRRESSGIALAGLGPVTRGYSVVATIGHIRSAADAALGQAPDFP